MPSLPPAYQALTQLPRALWVIAGANFINRCGCMVTAFLLVYCVKELGMPLQTAGMVTACFSVGGLLAAPWSARLCRGYDSVGVMVFSLLSAGALMALLPLVRSPQLLAPLVLATGCLTDLCRPAGYTAINHFAGGEQKRAAFTLHRLALNLGMSVGPALGGFLAGFSYRWLFWVDGSTSLLAGLVLLTGRVRAGHGGLATPTEEGSVALLDRGFYRLVVAQFLSMLVFCQVFSGLPVYVVKVLGRPELEMGLLYTLNTVLVLLCEPTLNYRISHWPLARTLALGNLLLALGLGSLALHHHEVGLVLGFIVFTSGEMLQASAGPTYLGRTVPPARLPQAHAWFVGAGSLAAILSPLLAANLLDFGGGGALWSVILGIGFLAAMLMWSLPEISETFPRPVQDA